MSASGTASERTWYRISPLDDTGVFAHTLDRRTHRRQIDQQRNTRKILQNNTSDDKRYFVHTLIGRSPRRKLADMSLANALAAVKIAQNGFEHNADRNRQPRDIA